MLSKWIRIFWKVLPPSFFVALIVTVIFAVTKLELNATLFLTFEINPSTATIVKIYFDNGDGFSEKKSAIYKARNAGEFQTLRFAMPDGPIKRLRMDPFSKFPGYFSIRNMKIIGLYDKEISTIPLDAFVLTRHMGKFEKENGDWIGVTTPDAFDPQMMIEDTNRLTKVLEYPFRMKLQHVLAANAQLLLQLFGTVWLMSIIAYILRHWYNQE